MQRVFLDANVLFSAAYRADAGLARLWKLSGVKLLTSTYALAEAGANLDDDEQSQRLDRLAKKMEVVPETADPVKLPRDCRLPDKDIPILRAAVYGKAAVLLTGDLRHFGPYLDKTVAGVMIQTPARFLAEYENIADDESEGGKIGR